MAYPKNHHKLLEAEKLVPLLVGTAPGEIVSYADISNALGRRFGDQETRQILKTARDIAERQGKMFRTLRGSGLRAFVPEDYEDAGRRQAASVHNAARRGYKSIDAITEKEFQTLNNGQQLRHAMRQGQLEMLAAHSSERRFEKVMKRSHNRSPNDFNMRTVAAEFASLDVRKPKREIR